MPVFVGGVVAVGALAAFLAAHAASRPSDSAAAQSFASATVATLTARLDAEDRLLAAASEAIGGDPTRADEQLRTSLSRVAPQGKVMGIVTVSAGAAATIMMVVPARAAPSAVGFDVASHTEWRLSLGLARDAARPFAAVASGPDGHPTVLDALPLYGQVDAPIDIVTRRATLKGYLITLTPVDAMIDLHSAVAGSQFNVRIVQTDTVLGSFGPNVDASPPSSATSAVVRADSLSWTVQAWADDSSSVQPWVVLGGGLLLAVAIGAIVESRERSVARMVTVAEARAQELALVARTGPLLQQSLELGDLLPMFVVAVSDELALDSISISLVSDAGQMVRVFSLGTDASPLVAGQSALATPESVGPGEAVTFPLQRAGRVVGALRARTSRGLTGPQVEALVAACNLLAAALGNARLFQDEQEMVARLREVDQLKTTFIGAVSHELNTTLTAIVGFAGLLEADRSMLDATHADYIERLSRNARSLGVLVEDLLDIARIERSSISVALRPTDLSDLVPKVVDQMSSILDGRRVSRIVEPGVTAIADAAAVERILANLLSNAAKYTPVGTAVDVALEREGEMAVISVSDHGPGIPVNEREKVFELFYRANDATSGTRGIGIGLALVRQLAKQLHGTIAVDDTPAGGARFRVKLPIIEAPLASRAFTNQPASSS